MYIQNDFQKCTPYVTEVTGLLSDPLKVIIACRVHQNSLNTYSQKQISKISISQNSNGN